MISLFFTIFFFDLKKIFFQKSHHLMLLNFFLSSFFLFSFVIPTFDLWVKLSFGIFLVLCLFTMNLASRELFFDDAQDGFLEQLILSPLAFEWIFFAKQMAFFVVAALPLLVMSWLLFFIVPITWGQFFYLLEILFLTLFCLSALIALSCALQVGLNNRFMLQQIIVFPFAIPVFIFASGTSLQDQSFERLLMLFVLSLIYVPLCCFFGSRSLKDALKDF